MTFRTEANLELVAWRIEDCIEMVLPVYETSPAQAPSALVDALGSRSIVNAAFNRETKILLLEIADAKTLAELPPDYQALLASHNAINGVLVTAPSIPNPMTSIRDIFGHGVAPMKTRLPEERTHSSRNIGQPV